MVTGVCCKVLAQRTKEEKGIDIRKCGKSKSGG